MNLRITNQPRQDYPFKGCKTIEDNTDSSEVVKCSPVKKNYKIPNKKEEQTVACFKKVVFCTVKGSHLKCGFLKNDLFLQMHLLWAEHLQTSEYGGLLTAT